MNAKWILAAACAATLTTLNAQDEGSIRERIRQEVAEKQRLMREGKIIQSNVRVTVRLTNGSRIIGVVKNGRFVERHDGLSFITSERVAKDAGLRLWYYDQTNSYIFLPWDSIAENTIGEVLTDEEVTRMGIEFERLAKGSRGSTAEGAPAPKPGPGGAVSLPGTGSKPGEITIPTKTSTLTDVERALLTEYPPEAGWGEQRRQDLELRKIQIHVFPDDHEQRFLDNFAAWTIAFEKRQAEEDSVRANQPGAAPPGGVVPPSSTVGEKGSATTPAGGKPSAPRGGAEQRTKAKGS